MLNGLKSCAKVEKENGMDKAVFNLNNLTKRGLKGFFTEGCKNKSQKP
jgi:hypothetical protein